MSTGEQAQAKLFDDLILSADYLSQLRPQAIVKLTQLVDRLHIIMPKLPVSIRVRHEFLIVDLKANS